MSTARMPFICGNWKMNKTIPEAVELIDGVRAGVDPLDGVEVGVAPPATALFAVHKRRSGSKLRLAAQNVHFEGSGAFTGEVSVAMLADAGCDYAIIGHSERRALFGETDEGTGKKVGATLRGGLRVILCVGESLGEREGGHTLSVVSRQLRAGLAEVEADRASEVVVAYEPVWAIGTGKVASPAQAQEVHAHLRGELEQVLGADAAQAIRLQYGGSMKPGNAAELLGQPDVDGGLIGGASLKAADFVEICRIASAQR